MKLNGYQPMQPTQKQAPMKKPPMGQEASQSTPVNRDTYTPSASAMSATSAMSAVAESLNVTVGTSYDSAEDYNYHLLDKYEGMTEYNITVSDELLEKAMNDPETAEKLESYIASTINAHENYDGDWIRVHTETEIEDITSSGTVKTSSLHVFASDEEYADLFKGKEEMDNYLNEIERMLVSNATGETSLSDTEADMLEKVNAVFDEVFNGTNASTGFSNFLNKALLNAEHITGEVIADNERIMGDVASLKEELTAMLEDDSISEEVRGVLEEALTKCDDILGGDSPLYDVVTEEITVTYNGRFDQDAFDASRPDPSLSPFFGEDSEEALESFREYMMKSNANLISLMKEASETDSKEDVVNQFYEELQLRLEEAAAEREEALEEEAEAEALEDAEEA